MMKKLFSLLLSALCFQAVAQPVNEYNIIKVQRNAQKNTKITTLVFDPALKPFYHGVASGDPTTSSVVIWTRVTPDTAGQPSITGNWQMAQDTGFTQIVKNGSFTADTATDYTVKLDVTGLNAGATYYYRFTANGKSSLIGRAKTIPVTGVNHLKFAIVSCSNYEGGFFNAYRKIAERNDLDAVVHLGDYIYEYGAGTYGISLPNRINDPSSEILTLSDYRTRYSLYRLDKDLIRLHQQHTFMNIWDDHESANDSWENGAENHQPNEGNWQTRKGISKKVYFEWMPIRNNATNKIYRNLSYGNLCDLIMLDTRLEGRMQPPAHFDTPDNPSSPRKIMSDTQMNWLISNLKNSSSKWKIIGNQVLYSVFNVGFAGGFSDGSPDPTNIDSIRGAEDLFIDNWESYPVQRHSLLDTIKHNNINNVVFATGDSHCTWAFDVPDTAVIYPNPMAFNLPTPKAYNSASKSGYNGATQQGSWAVEYGTPSISSPNFDESVGAATTALFEMMMNNPIPQIPTNPNYNPHLRYVDLDRHGYFILDVKNDSVHADFYYVDRIDTNYANLVTGNAFVTPSNSNKVSPAAAPAAPKTTQDIPTPEFPPVLTDVQNVAENAVLFGVYPNPASNDLYIQMGLQENTRLRFDIVGIDGKLISLVPEQLFNKGLYDLRLSLEPVKVSGQYIVILKGKNVQKSFKIQVIK